eukprot:EG_transcript_19145
MFWSTLSERDVTVHPASGWLNRNFNDEGEEGPGWHDLTLPNSFSDTPNPAVNNEKNINHKFIYPPLWAAWKMAAPRTPTEISTFWTRQGSPFSRVFKWNPQSCAWARLSFFFAGKAAVFKWPLSNTPCHGKVIVSS